MVPGNQGRLQTRKELNMVDMLVLERDATLATKVLEDKDATEREIELANQVLDLQSENLSLELTIMSQPMFVSRMQ